MTLDEVLTRLRVMFSKATLSWKKEISLESDLIPGVFVGLYLKDLAPKEQPQAGFVVAISAYKITILPLACELTDDKIVFQSSMILTHYFKTSLTIDFLAK